MEKIELVVTHHTGAPADRVWSATFGIAGGTIGRSGQNKLVLPDTDAEVARVHAMVRLDSDHAYIANLCERRSIQVNGTEVFSGQEVPLHQGSEVLIGSYRLLAQVLGTTQRSAAASMAPVTAFGHSHTKISPPAASNSEQEATPLADLASLPNPWADIPPIVSEHRLATEWVEARAGASTKTISISDTDSNPFAILGRVESSNSNSGASMPPGHDQPFGENDAPIKGSALSDLQQRSEKLPNASSLSAHALDTTSALQSTLRRPMVIPDDFNPFAADPKEVARQRDAWSGDLAAQSLAEVAPLKNDELLQSLPRTAEFAGDMDNAAHKGLPKQLDPHIELNPLKLFREPGEPMNAEAEDHGLGRGSDLAQIFNMPQGTRRETPCAGVTTPAQTLPISPSAHQPQTEAAPSTTLQCAETARAAGLQTMQGLDLDLFGASAADLSAPQTSSRALQSEAQEPPFAELGHLLESAPSHPSEVPAASFKGFKAAHGMHSTAAHRPLAEVSAPSEIQNTRHEYPPKLAPNELAAAFLEGAGIAPDRVAVEITPGFMRDFGEALRVAVQGSIDLLSARSAIKREFRADVTIIASGKNNPLKFLPTAEGVMLQLVGQNFPGFMPPVPAIQEAFKDLAIHQIGLMAGIRAAYAEAVTSLSPELLEEAAANSASLLSKLSSVHRKAALWDVYQQRYESIRQHAEDDLMAFSGHTFVQAYENAAQAAGEES